MKLAYLQVQQKHLSVSSIESFLLLIAVNDGIVLPNLYVDRCEVCTAMKEFFSQLSEQQKPDKRNFRKGSKVLNLLFHRFCM